MKRLLVLLPLTLVLLAVAPGARAAAPDEHGWWTSFAGPNPDVPSDGMLIQGGASATSPSAFGAVVYSVPDGSTVGKLTLALAPSSASVPLSKLELCPLASTVFDAAQGGAMSKAPDFDCTKSVRASPSSSGNTYEFDVSSLVNGGALAVAILPTSPTDRVALAAPNGSSLAVTPDATVATQTAPAQTPVTDTAPATRSNVASPADTPAVTPAPPARAAARNAAAEYVPTLAAGVTHARGAAVALVLVGALLIGGGWLVIGRISVVRALAELEGSAES